MEIIELMEVLKGRNKNDRFRIECIENPDLFEKKQKKNLITKNFWHLPDVQLRCGPVTVPRNV